MNGAVLFTVLFTVLLYLISNHLSPFLIFLILMNIAISLSYPMFLQNSELYIIIPTFSNYILHVMFYTIILTHLYFYDFYILTLYYSIQQMRIH